MPLYSYTSRDNSGAPVNGTVDAESIDAVQRQLRGEGKYPTSIRLASADAAPEEVADGGGVRLSRSEVIQFATELAIMVDTGVTLSEGLECIAAQSEKPHVKELVQDLSRTVQEGKDFSFALSRHPKSFPRLFIALIRASEKSGMLSRLLGRATAYMRDEQETMRKVKGALTYPGIMLGFAVATTIFLLAFVLPKFTLIYASKKAALPVPTKILMAMSGFLVSHWLLLILMVIAAAVGVFFYVRTPRGTRHWHSFQLHMPLMGPMHCKLHLSRGMRMIGTLAGAGVSLVDCVATAKDLCGNTLFTELWNRVLDQIQAGKQLSEPLFESRLVPRSVSQMLHSGEKSGKLASVLEQISSYAEQELKEQIATLTRYIEPAMILLMGLIIGGVALALLLPIFTISKVVAS